jgi:hypothetical protein
VFVKKIGMVCPLFLLTVGLFAQDVRYNFAAGKDFAAYKTYKWVELKPSDQLSQLADQQLKSAVELELSKKGLAKVDGDNADLLLGYQASVGTEKQYTSFDSGWGYGPGWGGGWHGGGGGMTTGQTSTIYIGNISLDMYEPAQKQLVWRGTVSKALDPKAKPEKRQKNLGKALAKLLKNYPPPEKKS